MKVAIIGGGVMGEAILAAALDRGVFQASQVTVCERLEQRRKALSSEYGIAVSSDAGASLDGADLVLLSVKPQDLHSIQASIGSGATLLSIMAGVTIETIRREFGQDRIIRAMPNTPVAAKAGMTVWTATEAVPEEQRALARNLLGAIGREIYVDDEKKLDMATAVSGSGPAYVFLFVEAMVEGAVAIGLTRAQAEEMVLQTVYGSAIYAQESGRSAAELRAMVTSPAGTTAAGLLAMERGALRADIIDGVRAAFARAQELGAKG